MAYPQKIKDAVRASYIFEQLTLEHCAEKHGVPYNTVRRWKTIAADRGDKWDKARNAQNLAEGGLGKLTDVMLSEFATQMQAIMDELKDDEKTTAREKVQLMSKLADAYAKTVAAAGKSDKKMNALAVAMKVVELQKQYILENYPQHREAFADILEPFGAVLVEELSGY